LGAGHRERGPGFRRLRRGRGRGRRAGRRRREGDGMNGPPKSPAWAAYAWGAGAALLIVLALVAGLWVLELQTETLEDDAHGAVCISLAHQQILVAELDPSLVRKLPDLRKLCGGQSVPEILAHAADGDLAAAAGR